MRGLYSSKTKIRHQIFTEIARLAYEGDMEKEMDELPYKNPSRRSSYLS